MTHRFTVRDPRSDDAPAVRALYRRPMAGPVRLTTTPTAVGVTRPGRREVVIESPAGVVVAYATRRVLHLHLGRAPVRVGYLGGLRVREGARLTRRLVGEAFEWLAAARAGDELPFDLTSILVDNTAARRALEARVRGLPAYAPLNDLLTLTLAARAGRVTAADLRAAAERYATLASTHDGRPIHAPISGVAVESDAGVGWVSLADPDPVCAGLGARLAAWRPLLNAAGWAARRATLPAPGAPLRLAFLTHIATDRVEPGPMAVLVRRASAVAYGLGARRLAFGLPEGEAARAVAKRTRAWVTPSRLYAVHTGASPQLPEALWPEIAQL